MPCPTHALQNSPSWKKLTAKQKKIKGVIDLCLEEVSLMTEINVLKQKLEDLRENILH